MNQGVLQQSSPVQQMIAAAGGNPNLWSINTMRPPPTPETPPYCNFSSVPPPTPNLFPSSLLLPIHPSWLDHHQQQQQNEDHHQQQQLPESWSQLLLGGLAGEEDKASLNQDLLHRTTSSDSSVAAFLDVKQEIYGHANHDNQDFQTITKPSWSQVMPVSPPKSCLTTTNNMLDFSSNMSEGRRRPPPDRPSSEFNSTSATGGASKKARVQPSSTQSPFKVRKEKLGDRINALHQLVSPFGKTDTASVLLEAIGYIRFLQNQIEALSLPYLGGGNLGQGERNCVFPEGPGQVSEGQRDLRSRGLCLVPVSCTLQVGSDNGADYWAPPAFNGGFR